MQPPNQDASAGELPECCRAGFLWKGKPTGTVETLGGVEAYVARPQVPTDKYILILTDVFGHVLVNVRLIADCFAKAGFNCVVPDILHGDPLQFSLVDGILDPPQTYLERVTQVVRTGWIVPNFAYWLSKHYDSNTLPVVDAVLDDLKTGEWKAGKVGVVGYCFGGRYAILKGSKADERVDAVVGAHPSNVSVPKDIEALGKPTLFVLAGFDWVFTNSMVEMAKKVVKETGKEGLVEFVEYKGTKHGFAVRGQENDPVTLEARNEATSKMIDFFRMTLA
ncbi:hypothetical protein HDV05_004755 [Chytridiales sp. JEL 0842]|nr:hypothetical protein HDV05_004755 [Chytridiales sp. JEL 0842]